MTNRGSCWRNREKRIGSSIVMIRQTVRRVLLQWKWMVHPLEDPRLKEIYDKWLENGINEDDAVKYLQQYGESYGSMC